MRPLGFWKSCSTRCSSTRSPPGTGRSRPRPSSPPTPPSTARAIDIAALCRREPEPEPDADHHQGAADGVDDGAGGRRRHEQEAGDERADERAEGRDAAQPADDAAGAWRSWSCSFTTIGVTALEHDRGEEEGGEGEEDAWRRAPPSVDWLAEERIIGTVNSESSPPRATVGPSSRRGSIAVGELAAAHRRRARSRRARCR